MSEASKARLAEINRRLQTMNPSKRDEWRALQAERQALYKGSAPQARSTRPAPKIKDRGRDLGGFVTWIVE